jgi:alanine-synthesizing transaminase
VTEALNNTKEHNKALSAMREEIRKRVTFTAEMINESRYMQTVLPNGAFYIFPKLNMDRLRIRNDKEFISKLLIEERIQIARGSGFGEKDHVRIVALAGKDVLKAAVNKMESFCRRHKKGV